MREKTLQERPAFTFLIWLMIVILLQDQYFNHEFTTKTKANQKHGVQLVKETAKPVFYIWLQHFLCSFFAMRIPMFTRFNQKLKLRPFESQDSGKIHLYSRIIVRKRERLYFKSFYHFDNSIYVYVIDAFAIFNNVV